MSAITLARQEHIEHQYVLTLMNDHSSYKRLKHAADNESFGTFTELCCSYTRKIRVNSNDGFGEADWDYFYFSMWEEFSGPTLHGDEKYDFYFDRRYGDLPATTKEITMPAQDQSVPFKTEHFVYGANVAAMSEQDLIGAIKQVEKEITALGDIKTPSKKIAANVTRLNEALALIVGALDAR